MHCLQTGARAKLEEYYKLAAIKAEVVRSRVCNHGESGHWTSWQERLEELEGLFGSMKRNLVASSPHG